MTAALYFACERGRGRGVEGFGETLVGDLEARLVVGLDPLVMDGLWCSVEGSGIARVPECFCAFRTVCCRVRGLKRFVVQKMVIALAFPS